MTPHFSVGRCFRVNASAAFRRCSFLLCVFLTDWDSRLINMPGMWTHLWEAPVSPLNCHLCFTLCEMNRPVLLPHRRSATTQSSSSATRTGPTSARDSWVSAQHVCFLSLRVHVFHSFTHDAPVCYYRRLLAPGGHRLSDPKERGAGSSRPPRSGLWPQIRRHLSLPGENQTLHTG